MAAPAIRVTVSATEEIRGEADAKHGAANGTAANGGNVAAYNPAAAAARAGGANNGAPPSTLINNKGFTTDALGLHVVTRSPSGHMWSVVVTPGPSGHM